MKTYNKSAICVKAVKVILSVENWPQFFVAKRYANLAIQRDPAGEEFIQSVLDVTRVRLFHREEKTSDSFPEGYEKLSVAT